MTNVRKGRATDSKRPPDCQTPRLAELREAAGAERADEQTESDGDGHPDGGCTDGRPSGDNRSRKHEHERSAAADDGAVDAGAYAMYTDEEYGYRIAYPAGWSVEAEPTGGASFGASGASVAGAAVFVDERIDTLDGYVEAFMDDLRADEHAHTFEPAIRRDVRLKSGQPGQVIECPYVGDSPAETWRLMYLFAVVGGIGYTVGVDWNDADPLGESAALIVGSFAVEGE